MDFSTRQPRRAAADAYMAQQQNRAPFSDGQTPGSPLMPTSARLATVAAAAYMIACAAPVQSEPQASMGWQPDVARAAQRAPATAYSTSTFIFVPVADNLQDPPQPCHSSMPNSTPAAQRASNDAYFISQTIVREELLAGFGHQDQTPRPLARASYEAYAIRATFQREELLAGFGHQTHRAPGVQRAAAQAYWIEQRSIALFDTGIPVGLGHQDWTPRRAARAGPEAYFIPQRFIWLELGQPPVWGYQDWTPRQWPRAANAAYWIDQRARGAEESAPAQFGFITASATAPARAAPIAYWIEKKQGSEGPDRPAGIGFQTDLARQAPRAASEAYSLIQRPVREEPAERGGYVEPIVRQAQRSSPVSYWIEPRLATLDPGRPISFGHQTERAPVSQRAAFTAYLIAQGVPAIELPAARGYVETASLQAPRSATAAYWLEQHPFIEGALAGGGHQAHSARAAVRSASSAYWIDTKVIALDTGRPVSFGHQTDRAPAAARATADAYWTEPRLATLDYGRPSAFGHWTETTPAARRAAASAYIVSIGIPPIELPAARGFQSDRALQATVANAAFWIHQRSASLDPGAPPQYGWQGTSAVAAQRSAPSAYWQPSLFVAADPPCPGRQEAPQQAVPPARAAWSAYVAGLSGLQIADPMPAGRGFAQERSRPIDRAPSEAYAARQPTQTPLGEEKLHAPAMPERAPSAQRSSWSAYWIDQRARIAEESYPAAFGFQTHRAPPARRATNDAYWGITAPAAQDPCAFGYLSQPLAVARANSAAYSILVPVPAINIPLAFGYQEWQPRIAPRSAFPAYWTEPRLADLDPGAPVGRGYQEWRGLPSQRTLLEAYRIQVAFVVPEIVRVGIRYQIYGCDGSLAKVHGNSVERVPVYGEAGWLTSVRGDTT